MNQTTPVFSQQDYAQWMQGAARYKHLISTAKKSAGSHHPLVRDPNLQAEMRLLCLHQKPMIISDALPSSITKLLEQQGIEQGGQGNLGLKSDCITGGTAYFNRTLLDNILKQNQGLFPGLNSVEQLLQKIITPIKKDGFTQEENALRIMETGTALGYPKDAIEGFQTANNIEFWRTSKLKQQQEDLNKNSNFEAVKKLFGDTLDHALNRHQIDLKVLKNLYHHYHPGMHWSPYGKVGEDSRKLLDRSRMALEVSGLFDGSISSSDPTNNDSRIIGLLKCKRHITKLTKCKKEVESCTPETLLRLQKELENVIAEGLKVRNELFK